MSDLNRAQIIGHLGHDPETNQTSRGTSVVNAAFATNSRYRDKDGTQQERTEWHRVVFYGSLADIVQQYMLEGSRAFVEGRLKTSKWRDNNDVERYTTEIVAENLQMLDK